MGRSADEKACESEDRGDNLSVIEVKKDIKSKGADVCI